MNPHQDAAVEKKEEDKKIVKEVAEISRSRFHPSDSPSLKMSPSSSSRILGEFNASGGNDKTTKSPEEEESSSSSRCNNLENFAIPLSDLIDDPQQLRRHHEESKKSDKFYSNNNNNEHKLSTKLWKSWQKRRRRREEEEENEDVLMNGRGGGGDDGRCTPPITSNHSHPRHNSNGKIRTIKRTLTNFFRFKLRSNNNSNSGRNNKDSDCWLINGIQRPPDLTAATTSSCNRALPPLPSGRNSNNNPESTREENDDEELPITFGIVDEIPPVPGTAYFPDDDEEFMEKDHPSNDNDDDNNDIATSIEKVKDYGWYWGPISGEVAERVLENEPDGSFIVRDSSAQDYIFSLTVKINGSVRHVRIDHGKGNFSFGSSHRFKSNTIGDFIENAVEHSRSGRYLFFLHRRPELGPSRVQLLHPCSRFKQVQSLQHLSRFIILKHVTRDQLNELPVPKRIRDYLNTPFYYSEKIDDTFVPPHEVDNNNPTSSIEANN